MIILRNLKWSNWFSYGSDNEIQFDKDTVTQIIGKVGAGKTSIPIIIQEVLFSKNNKGFKKSELQNRELNKPISAELTFTKGNVEYIVSLKRSSTLKINVSRDGDDISAHTAQGTYKVIETILGLDFKLFCQLTYQSSKNSLDFLTSTDTQRKKFLISLFNLDLYLKFHENYKSLIKDVTKEVAALQGSVATIQNWMQRNPTEEYIEMDEIPIPPGPVLQKSQLDDKRIQVLDLDAKNRAIIKNIQYKELLEAINPDELIALVDESEEKHELVISKSKLEQKIDTIKAGIAKVKKLGNECPTCQQDIPETFKDSILAEYSEHQELEVNSLYVINQKLGQLIEHSVQFNKHNKSIAEFENLSNQINPDLPKKVWDKNKLLDEIDELQETIANVEQNLEMARLSNLEIVSKNTKNKFLHEEWSKLKEELTINSEKLDSAKDLLYEIELLREIFSTGGLVAFKIQYLVRDLQEEITKYLQLLSAGRFQLEFQLLEDKLNIIIFDNGKETTITALSSGQLAAVNIATLLAIRKLMSTISSTKFNILFLDEAINTLDTEYKEALIDVLLNEHDLNIFIMSHEYKHPLVSTVEVINDGVSKIGQ